MIIIIQCMIFVFHCMKNHFQEKKKSTLFCSLECNFPGNGMENEANYLSYYFKFPNSLGCPYSDVIKKEIGYVHLRAFI